MTNRIIKFRAWDKTGKEMIEPNDFYQNADVLPNGDKTGCHLSDFFEIHKDGTIGKEHEDIVLMQFTGLLDKNGKEIWEGDIVRYGNDKGVPKRDYIVEWKEGMFITQYSPKDGTDYEHGFVDTKDNYKELRSCCEFQSSLIEIIGNVYEQSNLLK